MAKRIVCATMLCLVLFSTFMMISRIESAKACEPSSVYVPVGENVEVFPDPRVDLVFAQVTVEGWATAAEAAKYPPPPFLPPEGEVGPMAATGTPLEFLSPVWDIRVTATFSGKVIVGIDYGVTESVPTGLWQTDVVLGDVNVDGKVNLADLCIIIKALGSCAGSPRWNPYCDLNGDGRITLKDLCIAVQHFGQTSVWTNITTYVDTENHIIYGETDHFSMFGVTR